MLNCFAVCFLPVTFLSGDHTSSSPVDKHPNQLTTQHAAPPRRLLWGGVLPCQGLKGRIPVQLNPTNPKPRGKQVLARFLPPAIPPRFAQLSKHLPSRTPGTFPGLQAPAPGTQNRVFSPRFPLPAPPCTPISSHLAPSASHHSAWPSGSWAAQGSRSGWGIGFSCTPC